MFTATPDIFSNAVSLFDGGALMDAGVWRIAYIGGCLRLSGDVTHQWVIPEDVGFGNYYVITDGAGNNVNIPGMPHAEQYTTQAAAITAMLSEYPYIDYTHVGGRPIGIKFIDSPYGDNIGGGDPYGNPTWSLTWVSGPALAVPTLTAFGLVINGTPAISLQGH